MATEQLTQVVAASPNFNLALGTLAQFEKIANETFHLLNREKNEDKKDEIFKNKFAPLGIVFDGRKLTNNPNNRIEVSPSWTPIFKEFEEEMTKLQYLYEFLIQLDKELNERIKTKNTGTFTELLAGIKKLNSTEWIKAEIRENQVGPDFWRLLSRLAIFYCFSHRNKFLSVRRPFSARASQVTFPYKFCRECK